MSPIIGKVMGLLPELRRQLGGLARDSRGVSAVEFAMLAPLMVALYLGGVEIIQGVSIDRKLVLSARAIADLASNPTQQTISNAEMTNILNAGKAIAAPHPVNELKLWVAGIKVDGDKKPTIAWSSETTNSPTCTTPPPSIAELSAFFLIADSYWIWSQASYCYTPAVGYYITGTMKLKEQSSAYPRVHKKICREGVTCT